MAYQSNYGNLSSRYDLSGEPHWARNPMEGFIGGPSKGYNEPNHTGDSTVFWEGTILLIILIGAYKLYKFWRRSNMPQKQ